MMQERSRHQEKIIRDYYRNRDAIGLQKAQEAVTELYLSEGKKRVTVWKRLASHLEKIGLPQDQIDQDLAVLDSLGVEIRYSQEAGVDFTLEQLRDDGYVAVFVAVGAQLSKKLGLPGEDAEGILDGIKSQSSWY